MKRQNVRLSRGFQMYNLHGGIIECYLSEFGILHFKEVQMDLDPSFDVLIQSR